MASNYDWSSHIYWEYKNFIKFSQNRSQISHFYRSKNDILVRQLKRAQAHQLEVYKKSGALKEDIDANNLFAEILDPNSFEKFISYDKNFTSGDITTGRQMKNLEGMNLFEKDIISLKGTSQAFRKAVNKSTLEWQKIAEAFSKDLSDLFEDILGQIGARESFQTAMLQKWSQKGWGGLTQSERATMLPLRQNFQAINYDASLQKKFVGYLATMQKNLERLNLIAQGQQITKKKDLMDIAKTSAAVASFLGAEAGEIAEVVFAAQAQGEGFKTVADFVLAEVRSRQYITYKPDKQQLKVEKEYEQMRNYEKRWQKADVRYQIVKNGVLFEFGATVKRSAQRHLSTYGVGLGSIRMSFAMSEAGVYDSRHLLNAVMNTAAGHSEDKAAETEWNMIRDILATTSVLFALSGVMRSGKELKRSGKSPVIYLIVNNKPFLITDIMQNIVQSSGAGVIGHGGSGTSGALRRSTYVALNTREGKSQDSIEDSKKRSDRVSKSLIKAWQEQKISISLTSVALGMK